VPLGICTKKPERLTHKVLRDLGLADLFGAISGGDSLPHPKPDPRHLMSVIDVLQVPPAHVLYVGDSHFDAQMAVGALVPFVFARYGYDDGRVERAACYAEIDAVGEVPALLARLRADAQTTAALTLHP
jgi:phosphoglycolate phosphatase